MTYRAIYAYAWDIAERGVAASSPRCAHSASTPSRLAGATTPASSSGRKGKAGKVYFPEDGTVYFRADPTRYGAIKPRREQSSLERARHARRALRERTLR